MPVPISAVAKYVNNQKGGERLFSLSSSSIGCWFVVAGGSLPRLPTKADGSHL